MLPQVLKSTYEKEIELLNEEGLAEELHNLFSGEQIIPYEEIENSDVSYTQLRAAVQNSLVKINYVVKSRITKRYINEITPNKTIEELQEELKNLRKNALRQREILSYLVENFQTIEEKTLINKVTGSTSSVRSSLKALEKKGLLKLSKKEVYRNPYDDKAFKRTTAFKLTEEQDNAIQPVLKSIKTEDHEVFLLHGVTGSGKTEIYLQSIDAVLNQGKEAIVLVPEISLTPQMVKRFKERFGSEVAVLHSALSTGEKYDEWRKIHQKEVSVVVGARSAI